MQSPAEQLLSFIQTTSDFAPLVLIPLTVIVCMWFGSASLSRTLIWLATFTLGYATLQLGLLIALGPVYNRPVDMLPTIADIDRGAALTAANNAITAILYPLQLVALGLGVYSTVTQQNRNWRWMIPLSLALIVIPFAFAFPTIQSRMHPNQSLAIVWNLMFFMALLADAAVGVLLGYAFYANRTAKQQRQ